MFALFVLHPFEVAHHDTACVCQYVWDDVDTKSYQICANRAPVADAQATVNGRTVTVDGSGSTDPDGDTLTFSWNCGNQTTATGETAVCTYTLTQNGPFTITLTVTDEPAGCPARSDTDTTVVTIGP